jgi:hypothetical protein
MGASINALREEGTKAEILHELTKWMDRAEAAERQLATAREALRKCACDCEAITGLDACPLRDRCLGWVAKTYLADNPSVEIVAQVDRVRILEDALRPFAELAEAVEQNLPAKDDRWALVRVRDRGITYADLRRAKTALEHKGT